jgi:hypothetical protein
VIRDAEGRYLSNDEIEGIHSFLLEKGCPSPNITNIHLNYGLYKTEFSELNKPDIKYMEIPEHWIKSYIRNKKIDKLIEKRS